MIQINFQDIKWGIDPGDGVIRLNLLDPPSEIVAHVLFDQIAISKFIEDAVPVLTDEQKRALAPLFTSGLHLPSDGDIQGFQPGPQG